MIVFWRLELCAKEFRVATKLRTQFDMIANQHILFKQGISLEIVFIENIAVLRQ